MYYEHAMSPQIMRLVGQLLIAFADAQERPQTMPPHDPFTPLGGPDGVGRPPGFDLQAMLQGLGVPIPPGMFGGTEDDGAGLYGQEDLEGQGVLKHPAADPADAIQPRPFDPHDLPLEKYEDCAEKREQERAPTRRDTLRDDPLKWMDQAIYYALQMLDENCDAEDAARSFLCLPGGPTLRTQKAVNANVADEYDTGWAQANSHIQTAYDSDRIDATDFQDCMRRLGGPIHYVSGTNA